MDEFCRWDHPVQLDGLRDGVVSSEIHVVMESDVNCRESVSCFDDPTSQCSIWLQKWQPDYLSCDSVVDSASFYFNSLEVMKQFNITCSRKEIGEYVLSSYVEPSTLFPRKSSCVCGSNSALSQLDSLIGTSRHYMVNANSRESAWLRSRKQNSANRIHLVPHRR